MSEDRIKLRWSRHVVRGEGKSRSDAFERYSYRGAVLYSNDTPVARLVKGSHTKDWYCVSRSGVRPYIPQEWKTDGGPKIADTLYVECIGVFSRFEGDMVDDAKLHERLKWLWHCEAQQLIEKAQVWPADKLLVKPHWRSTGADTLVRDMQTVENRYHAYSAAFALGWVTFPAHYMADLMAALTVRREAYHDPKAVAQRERQVARRQAKEALGLD